MTTSTHYAPAFTAPQRRVYDFISAAAACFFSGDWNSLPFVPRLKPLIIGPTGIGKSRLIRELAADLDIPYIRLTYGDWIVCGAKVEPPTLIQLGAFVEDAPLGIVHFDELDKFGRAVGESDWARSVNTELLNTLDGHPTPETGTGHADWPPKLQQKFRENFFMVGTATFQHLFTSRPEAGFSRLAERTPDQADRVRRLLRRQEIIAPELVARFNSEIQILLPIGESEAEEMLEALNHSTRLRDLLADLDRESLIKAAIASGSNMRFFEELIARLLIEPFLKPAGNQKSVPTLAP